MADLDLFKNEWFEYMSAKQENERMVTHAEGCHAWGSAHYECAKRRITELEAQLADAQKDAAWIPVSERLPKPDCLKFITYSPDGVEVSEFAFPIPPFAIRKTFDANSVTHWMPLPKMPIDAAMQPKEQV